MKHGRGFTLIELLVAIAIIGILASIILVSVQGSRQKAKIAAATAELNQIRFALELLANDTGAWPNHQNVGVVNTGASNEAWDLNTQATGLTQTDGLYSGWRGSYMAIVPLDPWGNPYFFDTDYDTNVHFGLAGAHNAVVLGSFGPNGVGQNIYDADDVILVLVP